MACRHVLIIMCTSFIFIACGQKDETVTAPPLPTVAATWEDAAKIIAAACAGCHNGTKEPLLTPAATFKASAAKAELTAGSMPPPPATISASDKATLLSYLGSI